MWLRVFGLRETDVEPAALLEHLHRQGLEVPAHFRGDDQGWFQAQWEQDNQTLVLNRYLASEEGIRAELNTWAAWLELQEHHPQASALIEPIIGTRELFVLQLPDGEDAEAPLTRLGTALCRFLAEATEGIYQVDGAGFYSPAGVLLLAE